MSLQLITAPVLLALDWDLEVSSHLRVDNNDEQARVQSVLIPSASQWAESYTRRALITQTWKMTLDRFPFTGQPIELPKPPLQSLTHIKYYDGDGVLQTWSTANYDIDPAAGSPFDPECQPWRVWPKYGLSYPAPRAQRNAVEITFVCGYGLTSESIPGKLRSAMLMVVGEQFERREEAVAGQMSEAKLCAERLAAPFRVSLYVAEQPKPTTSPTYQVVVVN